jgi:hypothetical protein
MCLQACGAIFNICFNLTKYEKIFTNITTKIMAVLSFLLKVHSDFRLALHIGLCKVKLSL